MWILPKQLHTSAFAVDTQESAWDLKEFCQICEKSLMWRSKPTLSPTWLRRWKSLNYLQPLSSRTLKPSHSQAFVDAWTSSAAVSRVSLSQLLESVKQAKTLDTSSPSLKMELPPVDHDLFSWRTSRESSQPKCQTEPVFSSMCFKSWKAWVIEQRQEYSARLKSEQATRGKESSSLAWPTPKVAHCGSVNSELKRNTPHLEIIVKQWPTPNTLDHMGQRSPEALQRQFETTRKGRTAPSNLRESVFPANWQTPSASEGKANLTRPEGKKGTQIWLTTKVSSQSQDLGSNSSHMKNHELNPSWVEQLMGLPIGWTDCELAEME